VPEPIVVSAAAALAARSVGSLYDLVKRKFGVREEGHAALDAAAGATEATPGISSSSTHVAVAEAQDPAVLAELRGTWQKVRTDRGGVVNHLTGDAFGTVVQARDIEGGISF
jgi:hypothetical protein